MTKAMPSMLPKQAKRTQRTQRKWQTLILLWAVVSYSCTDNGIIAAIEDAESLQDNNLSNYAFVHSAAQIDDTVYLGSKNVWQKSSTSSEWSMLSLPSELNTDQNPVVSVATDGTNLFVASNQKMYTRNGTTDTWSSEVLSASGFSFYALQGASQGNTSLVLAVDRSNTIFSYSGGTWVEFLPDTKMTGLTNLAGTWYLAAGKIFRANPSLANLSDSNFTIELPTTESGSISNIIGIEAISGGTNSKDYIYALIGEMLYSYDPNTATPVDDRWELHGSSGRYIGLTRVDNYLIVGRLKAGYQIFDLSSRSWKSSTANDDFTDTASLVTLASGASINTLSLGVFLFYDDADDSKDRVYAATFSSDGVFSAQRNDPGIQDTLWSWALE